MCRDDRPRRWFIDVVSTPSTFSFGLRIATSVAQRRTRALLGFNLVYWTEHGMNYWAVSDLNQAELWEFCQLMK